jgi:hypothetical protein
MRRCTRSGKPELPSSAQMKKDVPVQLSGIRAIKSGINYCVIRPVNGEINM